MFNIQLVCLDLICMYIIYESLVVNKWKTFHNDYG